jgi:hypothetical protein
MNRDLHAAAAPDTLQHMIVSGAPEPMHALVQNLVKAYSEFDAALKEASRIECGLPAEACRTMVSDEEHHPNDDPRWIAALRRIEVANAAHAAALQGVISTAPVTIIGAISLLHALQSEAGLGGGGLVSASEFNALVDSLLSFLTGTSRQ